MCSLPNCTIQDLTASGSVMARLPMTHRVAPLSSQPATVAWSRIPPPSWTVRSVSLAICEMTSRLYCVPVCAPSRSTMCKSVVEKSAYICTTATGSLLYSVTLSKSPLNRRTHLPSLRSMAGMTFIVRSRRTCSTGVHHFAMSAQDGIVRRQNYLSEQPR